MESVRTIARYHNQDEEYMHPLWMGIVLLFSVIIVVGISCYLRIKCHARLRRLHVRLFAKHSRKNEHHSSDEKSSATNYSSNWPSSSNPGRNQSPKLYALVKNMRTGHPDRPASLKQKADQAQKSILPASSVASEHDHASEIARRFYASMRSVSQGQNSPPADSYGTDAHSDINTPGSVVGLSMNVSREENFRLFSTPYFFQSIPNTSLA